MSFWATWLGLGYLKASESARAAALGMAPIEDVDDPENAPTMVAGGKQTKAALPLQTPLFDGAIYSSRGRGYARYNEDAAALFSDKQGRMYAMVLDQAGGLGGMVRGKASALAAKQLWLACRNLAETEADSSAAHVLQGAFHSAHHELLGRSEGEVTTACAVVVREEDAVVVNSGDSGAIHFDKDGRMKTRTKMQEFDFPHAGCLMHAIGLEPEGCAPEPYRWPLEEGDWIVLASDGLLDSGLVEDELGTITAECETAEDVVNRVCTLALRRMGTLRAKPDNLTVVALKKRKV